MLAADAATREVIVSSRRARAARPANRRRSSCDRDVAVRGGCRTGHEHRAMPFIESIDEHRTLVHEPAAEMAGGYDGPRVPRRAVPIPEIQVDRNHRAIVEAE